MNTIHLSASAPPGSLFGRVVRPTLAGLLAFVIPLGLPSAALARHSEPTFVIVSGQRAVRDGQQVCFRLDGSDGGSERLIVRLRFIGSTPSGSITMDDDSSPRFTDSTQAFTFNVSVRGVHRLTLDLREPATIDWLSVAASDADVDIVQVSCSDYLNDADRESTLEGPFAEPVNKFEDQPSGTSTYHDSMTIPAGTELDVALDTTLSTNSDRAGDSVRGHLVSPVIVDGRVAIATGSRITGRVTESKRAGRFGRAHLLLTFDRAALADGTSVAIAGSVKSVGNSSGGRQTAIIAGSAVGGAIAAEALGVDPLIGAVVGGGVATGVIAAKPGKPVVLPAGTVVIVKLDQSVAIPGTRVR